MKFQPSAATILVLTHREGLGTIRVDLESFFEFSFELAEDLQDLVARWRHVAAPRDRLPRPGGFPRGDDSSPG